MRKKNESGQIIVILALAMVAIVAITALALDGSMGYSDRRKHQNTADSTSLAGAGAAAKVLKTGKTPGTFCGSILANTAIPAAQNASVAFAQTWITDRPFLTNLTTQNGVEVLCGSDYLDVHVMVTQDTDTTFARVIDQDVLTNTVASTARVYPGHPPGSGAGLVTVSPLCKNNQGGMTFGGGAKVELTNAGIFSNSCIKMEASSAVVMADETKKIYYVPAELHVPAVPSYDVCSGCPTANISPYPEPAPEPLGDFYLEPPKCGPGGYVTPPQNGLVGPGNYTSFSIKGDMTFGSGLYCIKGDFDVIKGNISGSDVTFFFEDEATFSLNDKYDITLTAPECPGGYDAECHPVGDCSNIPIELRGLLMYFAKPSVISLNGGTSPYFEGTIYAPMSDITLNGGSDTSFGQINSQIIGEFVKIDGGANLTMTIDKCDLLSTPPVIQLLK